MHSPTSQLSFATTEGEEAFDDEDSEKRLGKSLMLKLSRPEVEWGQPDHVSVWNAAHYKLRYLQSLF